MPPFGARQGSGAAPAVRFPATLGEIEIKDLTTAGDFAQADAWQRAGHVRNPRGSDTFLHAEVLGAWRRIDPVTITLVGRDRLQIECSCRRDRTDRLLCRHAAALLLQWARAPESFAVEKGAAPADFGPDDDEYDDLDGPDGVIEALLEQPSPRNELATLLDADTMNHLRTMARQRGLKIVARNKVELVEQLAEHLSQPESIDAALAGLSEDARHALEAAILVGVVSQRPYTNLISRMYQALGGKGKIQVGAPAVLESLVDLGLVMPEERQAHPSYAYLVPRIVRERVEVAPPGLDPVSRLVRQVDGGRIPQRRESEHKLGLADAFQVIVHELAGGTIGVEHPPLPGMTVAPIPMGWQIDKDLSEEERNKRDPYARLYRLAPVPSPLAVADFNHLAKLTGQSHRMLDLALSLLIGLGIVQNTGSAERISLVANEEALYRLFTYPQATRFELLTDVWLKIPGAFDLRGTVGRNRLFQLYYQTSYYTAGYNAPGSGFGEVSLRALLVHLLARTSRRGGPWYDIDSLLDFLWQMVPDLLGGKDSAWWYTDSKRGEARLKLDTHADWLRLWRPVVSALLAGPLTWLGLVEVALRGDQAVAFRVHPRAASLVGRTIAEEAAAPTPLTIEMERRAGVPIVTVPGASSDDTDRALLARIGNLVEASPRALRYQLTPGRLQVAFDDGLRGSDLIQTLTSWAGGRLPHDVRATLEQWWDGFGRVRLYDELALVELSDDILLRELRATTSLDRAMIHVLSPRVIAVDPAMVDDLVTELTRLGHTPRVIEDAS